MDDHPGGLGQPPEELRGPAGAPPERVIEADHDLPRAEQPQEDVPDVGLGLDPRELHRERDDQADLAGRAPRSGRAARRASRARGAPRSGRRTASGFGSNVTATGRHAERARPLHGRADHRLVAQVDAVERPLGHHAGRRVSSILVEAANDPHGRGEVAGVPGARARRSRGSSRRHTRGTAPATTGASVDASSDSGTAWPWASRRLAAGDRSTAGKCVTARSAGSTLAASIEASPSWIIAHGTASSSRRGPTRVRASAST